MGVCNASRSYMVLDIPANRGGDTMRLIIPDIKNYSTAIAGEPIKDGSGQTVGQLVYSKGEGRSVSLFGGKYTGRFDSQDGVVGFVRGVEAVLNHMTSTAR